MTSTFASELDAQQALATIAVGLDYDTVPDTPRSLVRRAVADVVGVGLAGAETEAWVIARKLAPRVTGAGTVPVWLSGDGARTTSAEAASVAAVACHSLDWDDYAHPVHAHCSSVLFPVCWAVTSSLGGSGKDLAEAYLAGYEIDGVLGQIMDLDHYERGWHPTTSIGMLGAAAAASRLLRLDVTQTNAALSLAATYASGLRANFGTTAKPFHAGHAARQGVIAALQAQAGISGNPNWLLGANGYLSTLGGRLSPADAAALLTGYGPGRLAIEGPWGLVVKQYSCCGSSHVALDCVIACMTKNDLSPASVRGIEVHVDPILLRILPYGLPHDEFEARYSLPYSVAVAALDRAGGPAQFAAERIDRTDVHALMGRVRVVPDLSNEDAVRFATRIEIETAAQRYVEEATVSAGHPSSPLSEPARLNKFRVAAGTALTAESVERMYELVSRIDELPDLREFNEVIEHLP